VRVVPRRRSASLAVVALIASLTAVCGEGSPQSVISGQVVETYCWAKLGVGGPDHASCGIQCVKRGIPAAVYDAESRQLFILLPGQDKSSVPPGLIAAMGRKVKVRGDVIRRAGTSFVAVQSWETE
jgi:hypothetical protein